MSRSNYDKPFYVDVGTSIVAIRCASNHDVIWSRDHVWDPTTIKLLEDACERMNNEFEIYEKLKLGRVTCCGLPSEGRSEMKKDYSNIGAVCFDCAKSAGFTPKDKVVGVWMDECGICHQMKPCTNLTHDWNPPKEGRGK